MTISSSIRKAGPYVGTGSQTVFPFAFKVFSASDLYVVKYDTATMTENVLTLTTHYTVSVNADQDNSPGGSVTLLSALASGYTLTITSALDYLQPTDLTNNGGFYPEVITNALDRLTIFCQQLYEQIGRSLKLAISAPPGVKAMLPVPVPYKLLGWDSTGTEIVNADPAYATALSSDLASTAGGKGATMVGFKQSGSGTVARTVQSKLQEFVSVLDFGADPTGVADCTTAINNSIAAAQAYTGVVYFPKGKYRVTAGNISITNVSLVGAGAPEFGATYNDNSSVILLDSATTTPFVLGLAWAIKDLSFFYPGQDGAAVSPIAYPPLFTGTYVAAAVLENVTIVNAYQVFKFLSGVAVGDIRIDRCRIYGIDKVFWFLQGAPEIINITDSMFSYGVYGSVANVGPNYYLRDYTTASGEFMRIDVGASSHPFVDGLTMANTLVYGYRYGIRVISGTLNVSTIDNNLFDATSTALSVEGSSSIANTSITDNFFWSARVADTTTYYPTISLSSNSVISNVFLSGNDFAYSQGDHINWSNIAANDVQIVGNRFKHWGKTSTGPASSYYAISITDSQTKGLISGNKFQPSSGAVAHNRNGIAVGNAADMLITSNQFEDCFLPVWVIAATRCVVQGNISSGTTHGQSFIDGSASAGAVQGIFNSWDKVPAIDAYPAFYARISSQQTFTGAKTAVNFAIEVYDNDANYDSSTSTFTAPTAGVYSFETCLVNTTGVTAGDYWLLTIEAAGSGSQIVGSGAYVIVDQVGAATVRAHAQLKLAAGDTVVAYLTRGGGTGNYVELNDAEYNYFTGRKVQ